MIIKIILGLIFILIIIGAFLFWYSMKTAEELPEDDI
jgi:uncharacterized protein YpmB